MLPNTFLFFLRDCFLVKFYFCSFICLFKTWLTKIKTFPINVRKKSNLFELSFHSLIPLTQLQRQWQKETIKERVSAGTNFLEEQWWKISECKWLLKVSTKHSPGLVKYGAVELRFWFVAESKDREIFVSHYNSELTNWPVFVPKIWIFKISGVFSIIWVKTLFMVIHDRIL